MTRERVSSPNWLPLGLIALVSPVVAFACWLAVGVPLTLIVMGGPEGVMISYQADIWLIMIPAAMLAGVLVGLMAGIRGWWLTMPSLLAAMVSGAAYAVMLANDAHPLGPNEPSIPVLALCIAAGAMLGALIAYLTGHGRPAPKRDATTPAPAHDRTSQDVDHA